jgi:trehalose 2-sulfotransferase
MTAERRYIVASTPRTGSYLLCEGLETTGVAGRPTEVFSPHFQEIWCRRWALGPAPRFQDYLAVALRHGTTSNGIYGLKIHWMHVGVLAMQANFRGDSTGVLDHLFPGAVYVRMIRRDRRAQAISYFRARVTNEWWRIDGVRNDQSYGCQPVFNPSAILALEQELINQDLEWHLYFRARGIEPLIVEYESVVRDYRGQVARVLEFLGLDSSMALAIPPPRLVRQADGLTHEWRRLLDNSVDPEGLSP